MAKFNLSDQVRHLDNPQIMRVKSYVINKIGNNPSKNLLTQKTEYSSFTSITTGKVICHWRNENDELVETEFNEEELFAVR